MKDFNNLEDRALKLFNNGRYKDALRIYFFMADGDNSLDGGYLGIRLAECYLGLGDKVAAYYWYGRAIEENPEVNKYCKKLRNELGRINVDDLI